MIERLATTGGKVRQLALAQDTIELLKRLNIVKREPFKDIGRSTMQGAIRRLTGDLAEHGMIRHRYSPPDFRHYFAVRVYRETNDVYAVKEALGHATVSVTEVYLAGFGIEK